MDKTKTERNERLVIVMLERKTLIAVLREHGKNYRITRVDRDYTSKKAYAHDCRANGYYVCCILTVNELNYIKHSYENRHRISLEEEERLFKKYPVETLELLSNIYVDELEEPAEEPAEETTKAVILTGFHVKGKICYQCDKIMCFDCYAQDLDVTKSYVAYKVSDYCWRLYDVITMKHITDYESEHGVKGFFLACVQSLERETLDKFYLVEGLE